MAATINDLQDKLKAAEDGVPVDLDKILAPAIEQYDAMVADREVRIDLYKAGLANGNLLARAVIVGVDVDENDLIKPVAGPAGRGAKPLSAREYLRKEARKYITLQGGSFVLRSNLAVADIRRADEIMEAFNVPKGTYNIPAE